MFLPVSLLIFLYSCVVVGSRWDSYTFEEYEVEFGKSYEREERPFRRALFESRFEQMRKHNEEGKSWKQGVNHLTDRTEEELKIMRGSSPNRNLKIHPEFDLNKEYDIEYLESQNVDWRDKNIITAVKDQGGCGSCWTFATAEVIESYYALSTGQLSSLSEQQILDCTPNPDKCGGTGGCGGGTAELAFVQLQKMGGLATEWTYPYVSYFGQSQDCKFNPSTTKPFAKVSNFYVLPQNKYPPVLEHLAKVGPLAINVDASAWSSYSSGVFDGCNQTNPDLDHLVLLVGYGVDKDYGAFWLVRNSWSAKWGENGYIRLKRDTGAQRCGEDLTPGDGDGCSGGPPEVTVCGTCGLLYDTAYPVVAAP